MIPAKAYNATEGQTLVNIPPFPHGPCSGRRWQDKVADVRAAMKAASTSADPVTSLLVSQLDEVAWLFNLRGDDLPNVPGKSGEARMPSVPGKRIDATTQRSR